MAWPGRVASRNFATRLTIDLNFRGRLPAVGAMNQRRVTLADVAREANVHVTTVSLAIRNHPRLPPATRARIRATAERLGYRPDPLLQALVAYRGKTMPRRNPPTLAYVTNWNTRLGWQRTTAHPQFYAGALSKARELGFNLEHFWMREPGLTHTRLSKILLTRGINGLIVASHMREVDVALHLDWSHFSAVKIDYFPHQPEIHNVTNNQCSIVRLAMQRVIAAGYRRIGFVMHRGWDHSVDHLWTAGFLCEQANVAPEDRIPLLLFPEAEPIDAWMAESKADVVAPQAAFARWYRKHRPEVVISKASFVQPCLSALGLRVPRDVSLVDVFLENPGGRMAGVRQNHETVGELAVEILAGQLHHNKYGVPEIPTTTYVEGTWFGGATCPPRRRAPARAALA
jgi:LacI family transcriptional regulator, galactose operon repressor